MTVLALALLIAALVLALMTLVEARGRSWLAWAVVCVVLAMLLPRLV